MGDSPHSIERIVLVPRNGYVNRLQAWASASILASEVGSSLEVMWEEEAAAPAEPTALFSQAMVNSAFTAPAELVELIGSDHKDVPRYLSVNPERRIVFLTGHDRGEQAFMSQLGDAMRHPCRPKSLVIIAGGRFHLPGTRDFDNRRRLFYGAIAWSEAVSTRYEAAWPERQAYAGLHIRQTDRAREAPSRTTIRRALVQLRAQQGGLPLFVAADTDAARMRWLEEGRRLGFASWTLEHPDTDRSSSEGAVAAMADWRVLGSSTALVYSAASTFGAEAVVAAGAQSSSFPISATIGQRRMRAARDLMRSGVGYPLRRARRGAASS